MAIKLKITGYLLVTIAWLLIPASNYASNAQFTQNILTLPVIRVANATTPEQYWSAQFQLNSHNQLELLVLTQGNEALEVQENDSIYYPESGQLHIPRLTYQAQDYQVVLQYEPQAGVFSLVSAQALINAYTLFSLNVQDFSYPQYSAQIVDKIITLHEQQQVPLDIYLTDTMGQIFHDDYPELFSRLITSSVVAVSYHTRPPRPYASSNDWYGIKQMSASDRYNTIMRYETHAVDPSSGETTDDKGGYQQLADLLGYKPYAASALSDSQNVNSSSRQVFKDLGARFTLTHGGTTTLGETLDGLLLRPEQLDYRLFEQVGNNAINAFENALAQAQQQTDAGTIPFIGVKMHDNDFFASQSAWVTIYVQDSKRPPWNPQLQATLLSAEEQDAVWNLYAATVQYVATQKPGITPLNLSGVWDMSVNE